MNKYKLVDVEDSELKRIPSILDKYNRKDLVIK